MLPNTENAVEKAKQLEFYRQIVKKAIRIIDPEEKGSIDKREVSYVMKFCLQFPSEAQVRDFIIPALEQDEPSKHVVSEKVESLVAGYLMKNEYEPATAERLLAAFRLMDPQGTGQIRLEVVQELLSTKGIQFRQEEIDSFSLYAQDKTGQYIEYEDYVAKLVEENERHKEYLLQDWYAMNAKK